MTNANRAMIAKKAISAVSKEDTRTGIIDMLVDIRHLCKAYGLGFHELDGIASHHYFLEEVYEERKKKR